MLQTFWKVSLFFPLPSINHITCFWGWRIESCVPVLSTQETILHRTLKKKLPRNSRNLSRSRMSGYQLWCLGQIELKGSRDSSTLKSIKGTKNKVSGRGEHFDSLWMFEECGDQIECCTRIHYTFINEKGITRPSEFVWRQGSSHVSPMYGNTVMQVWAAES